MNAFEIIKKPVLSEKSYAGIASKKYVFVVDSRADKTQIKNAVEAAFGVKVAKVNTVNVRGKLKRQGRSEGYTSLQESLRNSHRRQRRNQVLRELGLTEEHKDYGY